MWIGLLAIFLSGAIGGAINSVAVKLGVREIPPITFTTLRFLLSTICFLPIYFSQKQTKLYKKDLFILCAMSLFFAANLVLFSIGVQYTSAIVSQTLYVLSPILVVTFAHFLIQEKFTRKKGIGLFIALVGVLFLIYQSTVKQSLLTFGTPLGNILIIIGVVCYSFYVVFSRKLIHAYSPSIITLFNFILTTVLLAVFIPVELHFRPLILSKITIVGEISLVAMVFSSICTYFFLQIGIKRVSAFVGSLSLYISPFFAALTAVIIVGEKITLPFVLGGLLIASGVFYSTTFDQVKKYFKKD